MITHAEARDLLRRSALGHDQEQPSERDLQLAQLLAYLLTGYGTKGQANDWQDPTSQGNRVGDDVAAWNFWHWFDTSLPLDAADRNLGLYAMLAPVAPPGIAGNVEMTIGWVLLGQAALTDIQAAAYEGRNSLDRTDLRVPDKAQPQPQPSPGPSPGPSPQPQPQAPAEQSSAAPLVLALGGIGLLWWASSGKG